MGVSMTLVSIYLINQREQITQKFKSLVQQPAAMENQVLAEQSSSVDS
jgi:hypothetical protein